MMLWTLALALLRGCDWRRGLDDWGVNSGHQVGLHCPVAYDDIREAVVISLLFGKVDKHLKNECYTSNKYQNDKL